MSRFELGGQGEPISNIALPDPNIDPNLPPQVLVLEDGVPFLKADYVGLGYTHYEAWCVGAAGGRGGDGGARYGIYAITNNALDPAFAPPTTSWPYYNVPDPARPGYSITHYHDPVLGGMWSSNMFIGFPNVWGGGGGGGGLHLVSGLLVDLPDEAPVVVGQAGVDAAPGQISNPNPVTPSPPYTPGSVYDPPIRTFYPPAAGGDGGASSFNGETCRASGGKGGNPGAHWAGDLLMYEAKGGDGGCGGRTTAGGGGVGSTAETNPSDGTWDGSIGKGGGGGRGGMLTPHEPDLMAGF